MSDVARGDGKGAVIPVLDPWRQWIYAINDPKAGWYANDSTGAMWINRPAEPGKPRMAESITNHHNFISFDGYNESGSHGHVVSFAYDEDPWKYMSPAGVNWFTRPELFFKAISSNKYDQHMKVNNGLDVYIPILRRTELWLTLSKVELFPTLPVTVQVKWSTLPWLNIRYFPNATSTKIGQYLPGEKITITRYRPRGASVWGKTEKGWVCLLLADKPGQRQFFTTWKLDTMGVIPPG